jgi:geranylgeranyl reductase family protein
VKEFDVAIIGAGPAGSATAITLAQSGFDVVLIDRALFPRDKLCGDFINPINWPVLQELNVAYELLSLPHTKVSTFRLTMASGAEVMRAMPGQGESRFGLGLRRFHLDHVLLKQAARSGVSVHQGVKVSAVKRVSRGWHLEIDDHGCLLSARAKLLVGADGRNSWVARQIGVGCRPAHYPASVGFEIQLQKVPGLCASVEIHQYVGGYGGAVRVDPSTVNLCFTVKRSLLGRSISFDNLRERFLRHNPFLDGLVRASEPVSVLRSVWPVYFPARRCFGDGFLLVGDAARVTEPLTGEGIFFALRAGQLAARTMATALRQSNFTEVLLSSYDRACRSEFRARQRLNALIRNCIYRPGILSFAVPLLSRQTQLLDSLISHVCVPRLAYD